MEKTTFDISVRPQDDFFGYVNNHWLKENPIPSSEAVWGTFYSLRDDATSAIRKIVNDLIDSDESKLQHDQRILRRFFACAMNFDNFKANHLKTLLADLNEIAAISDRNSLYEYIGKVQRYGNSPFWNAYVDIDDKNSHLQILRLYQTGLGLPNRDYYLESSGRMKEIRQEYERYFVNVNKLAGTNLSWKAVWEIEHGLAENSWTDVAMRDIQKNYNRHSIKGLESTYNNINWQKYYLGLGWKNPSDNIVVGQPSYFEYLNGLLNERPLDDLKAYLSWRILNGMVPWLSKESAILGNNFHGGVLNGTKKIKPLWKRAVHQADRMIIGEALGREYAARYFPESSKKSVLDIVESIRVAFHQRINRLTWMQESTKKRAHDKLDNIKVLIGYPSVWKDLSALELVDDNQILNIRTLQIFNVDEELSKVGQATPEEEWEMNAHTVNAYHHPNRLEIVFPAAILQPPFYDPSASLATNLGGIGAVIGHEFTHGFDDQGSEFDEHGNTNPWQTPEERKEFSRLAQHIIDQADHFETVPGTYLQGELILGEAIADIGGLELAVEALKNEQSQISGDFEQNLKDLFISAARCECGHATPERLIELAKIDPHPPSPFRVNCIFGHVDAFYDAFGVKPDDGLYLPAGKRSKIW